MKAEEPPPVVALVPAHDAAGSIGATVRALRSLAGVDQVLVVDDGSDDGTAELAREAGARVLRLPSNRGKGGAVAAGVAAVPSAGVYLLVDADVGDTACCAARLLEPVLRGDADMAVAVLPGAGGRGGFGLVRRLAGAGIRRATGAPVIAPLSGQRAVRGELLRSVATAPRFGLETALTIDARRAGAHVVEVEVPMEHRHTGRSLSGFRHRAGQGVDITRALWPRLTTPAVRVALVVLAAVAAVAATLAAADRSEPDSVAASVRPSKVLIVGLPRLEVADLGSGVVPNLDAMAADGAVAAMTVRTLSRRPTTVEGYATLGAGTRVAAPPGIARAYDVGDHPGDVGPGATASRPGSAGAAEVAVADAADLGRAANDRRFVSSLPGALGDALSRAGRRAAVVGNADPGLGLPPALVSRPAAAAVMDSDGAVATGRVGPSLLRRDDARPFGVRADAAVVVAETRRALATADVVIVDAGDLERAGSFSSSAAPGAAEGHRRAAFADADRLLADLRAVAGPEVLVLVVAVRPRDDEWRLTPMVVAGAGVVPGHLHSASTKRVGLVTLTDVAPTVLDALGIRAPDGMVGHPLRFRPGPADLALLTRLDRDAAWRERIYPGVTVAYVAVQVLVYLAAAVVLLRRSRSGRWYAPLRWLALAVAAYPLSTFLLRALPGASALGAGAVALLVALDLAVVALAGRARRHPLAPLSVILAATVALLVVDVATGAHLQTSSLLGYSLHTANRFTGLGNTSFAVLAASTVVLAAIHVHFAPRRKEALVSAACLFALVLVVDGSPSLGSDVGGILTLVPVFGLSLLALGGRRISVAVLGTAVAATAVALALAAAVDLQRPPPHRTHLGRLVDEVRTQGLAPVRTTVARKWAASTRTYRWPWAWPVPAAAGSMLVVLACTRRWSSLLPPGSALRVGAVGALAAGLLGHLVNDSGVVVTAVVFVALGPLLTLLAVRSARGEPVVLDPAPPDRPPYPVAPVAGAAGAVPR